MKPIKTRVHGLLDYTFGTVLLLPWLFNYYEESRDTQLLALAGAFTITLSLLTDYEVGLIKLFSMKMHLVFDFLSAIFLLAMPSLFSITHYYSYWPTVLGAVEVLIIFLSSSKAYIKTKRDLDISKPL